MTRKERYKALIDYFSHHQPNAETELEYSNPFELLVAVVLSAQCTDKRVNIVTKKLFHNFPTPESLARADFDTLFPYIRSVSYPNNKTSFRFGQDAGRKVPLGSARYGRRTAKPTRCGPQDRQRNSLRYLQPTSHGSRYPCISCVEKIGLGRFKS